MAREIGRVTRVMDRGFAFLRRAGQNDIFAHASAFEPGMFEKLFEGQRVSFEVGTKDGRLRAVDVRSAE